MTGYFDESATAKCPTKDYLSLLQWILDVPILCKAWKNTRVSTNPTDPIFFCADPAIYIAFQKKNKKIFIPTDPKMFQKIGQDALKMSELLT